VGGIAGQAGPADVGDGRMLGVGSADVAELDVAVPGHGLGVIGDGEVCAELERSLPDRAGGGVVDGERRDDHVAFEVESIDRMYLNVWQARLAYGGGVQGFFVDRGYHYA
jgi:hypothetical protein